MSATAMNKLDLRGRYSVCYLRSDSEEEMAATVRALRPYMLSLLVEPYLNRVVGIVHKPPPGSIKVSIGVSAPRPLDDLGVSLREAQRANEVAASLGIRRCVTADEVPLLSAVLALPVTGDELVERCFGHVTGEQRAATVQTVDAYLAADGNTDHAAAMLFVHPNTVRYRLRRLTEDTGLSLSRTTDALMLWWAVRRFQTTHPGEESTRLTRTQN